MPEDKRKEEAELRPTSSPPEDVDIPTESIYGSNEALDPIDSEEVNGDQVTKTDDVDRKPPIQDVAESSAIGESKSIKIGWIPFLLFLILLTGGIFVAGVRLAPKISKSIPNLTTTDKTNLNNNTEPNQTNQENRQPTQNESTQTKPRKTINFVQDSGIYKRENKIDAEELARKRLAKAKNSVLWVTSEPNNRGLLSAISEAKESQGLPVVIVTGSETSKERIETAKKKGFVVNQSKDTLEVPYSFIIIDSKLLMDLSRKHWLWETTDKQILDETGVWLKEITKNATIVK
jgi:hypothetical protein